MLRDYKQTIKNRSKRDKEFLNNILKESIKCLLTGEFILAKVLFKDYIEFRKEIQ